MQDLARCLPTPEQIDGETRQIRRLRIAVNLALQLIAEGGMTLDEAQEATAATRRVASQFFPGKEAVYDLIYGSKFRRLIASVYRLH